MLLSCMGLVFIRLCGSYAGQWRDGNAAGTDCAVKHPQNVIILKPSESVFNTIQRLKDCLY